MFWRDLEKDIHGEHEYMYNWFKELRQPDKDSPEKDLEYDDEDSPGKDSMNQDSMIYDVEPTKQPTVPEISALSPGGGALGGL